MSLPEYAWPYIFYSLCLSVFIAIWAVLKMVNDHIENKMTPIEEEKEHIKKLSEEQDQTTNRTVQRIENDYKRLKYTRTAFNRNVNVLVGLIIFLMALSILHVYFYFFGCAIAINIINWMICFSILIILAFLFKIFFGIRAVLVFTSYDYL